VLLHSVCKDYTAIHRLSLKTHWWDGDGVVLQPRSVHRSLLTCARHHAAAHTTHLHINGVGYCVRRLALGGGQGMQRGGGEPAAKRSLVEAVSGE
jgi:hypothetical protein